MTKIEYVGVEIEGSNFAESEFSKLAALETLFCSDRKVQIWLFQVDHFDLNFYLFENYVLQMADFSVSRGSVEHRKPRPRFKTYGHPRAKKKIA